MLKYLSAIFALLLSHAAMATPMAVRDSPTNYLVSGVVISIAPDHRQASIHNQTIPGYMAEMTMDFSIKNTNELNGISPGDKITFNLAITKDDSWIQDIHRTGQTVPVPAQSSSPKPAATDEATTGMLPDGALTAEDGREIHFSDFRGQAVAFTFFYTRCPLPNYCPLMNRNFDAARNILLSAANAPTNWEFLSISFDPENDTPAVLTSFGGFYRHGNPAHWLFASVPAQTLKTLAPALDLMVAHDGSSISHNLRTVVLSPNGRIYCQFDGNQWTPKELAAALLSATGQ